MPRKKSRLLTLMRRASGVALPTPLIDLQADMLSLTDGDPVSSFTDQSGNGHHFTQSGAARPTYLADFGTGHPAVAFPSGSGAWMLGPDVADNAASFAVYYVVAPYQGGNGPVLTKINNYSSGQGWAIFDMRGESIVQMDGGSDWYEIDSTFTPDAAPHLYVVEKRSNTEMHIFTDGVATDSVAGGVQNGSVVTDFSTTEPIRIGAYGVDTPIITMALFAVRFYSPAPSSAARSAIETALAARYGVTI